MMITENIGRMVSERSCRTKSPLISSCLDQQRHQSAFACSRWDADPCRASSATATRTTAPRVQRFSKSRYRRERNAAESDFTRTKPGDALCAPRCGQNASEFFDRSCGRKRFFIASLARTSATTCPLCRWRNASRLITGTASSHFGWTWRRHSE